MFNRLKRKVIQEVMNEFINELKDLCDEYDNIVKEKHRLNENVDFELGIGSGLRKAIGKAFNIKNKHI